MKEQQIISALKTNPVLLVDAIRSKELLPSAAIEGTPLLSLAIENNCLDVANALLENGADVNQHALSGPNRGKAPIHFVKTVEALDFLLSVPADVNSRYKFVDRSNGLRGETLLHTAVLAGDTLMVSALLNGGANDGLAFGNVPAESEITRPENSLKTEISRLTNAEQAKEEQAVEVPAPVSPASQINTLSPFLPPSQENSIAQFTQVHIDASATQKQAAASLASLVNGRVKLDSSGAYIHQSDVNRKVVDTDGKLVVHSSTRIDEYSHDLIKASIELAKHKGWPGVVVNGDEAFKKESWLLAKAAGLQVSGYEPTPQDISRLQKYEQHLSAQTVQVKNKEAGPLLLEAQQFALRSGGAIRSVNKEADACVGPIVFSNDAYLVQSLGRNRFAVHDKSEISGAGMLGNRSVKIHYAKGQTTVQEHKRGFGLNR